MLTSLNIASKLQKKYAISQEDALQLYPYLCDAVKNSTPINVSFEGLENCSTLFLRSLLGELYLTFGPIVDEIVKYSGIDKDDNLLHGQLERLRRRALNPEIYQPIFEDAIGLT